MKLLNPAIPFSLAPAGGLKAVVLDWAGTTVDFGSMAPARTLQRLFGEFGIVLSDAETRRDMGLPKKDHIRAILASPGVRAAWQKTQSHVPDESDVANIYERFIPMQLSCLAEYSELIPGVVDAVEGFRRRGLKIGSTTGYPRAMLDSLLVRARKQGYSPDCSLAPEDVGAGRPQPFMLYESAVRLQVYPMTAMVKVGDTAADIHEALNAGCWAVGVAGTGNGVGVSLEEFKPLTAIEKAAYLARSRAELERAGAHFVIDTLAEADSVLDNINARLRVAAKREC